MPSVISEPYDYAIIGGGTAGLVLANRLSEDPSTTVVVLEAGGDATADPRVTTPALFTASLGTKLDWTFGTVPQKELNNRRIGHSAGKLLGGTSGLNAQAIIPPSSSDIDAWEELGNENWNYQTLAPYLEKPFNITLPDKETADHLHVSWAEQFAWGKTGPIKASFPGVKEDPISKAWVETFENLGYPLTKSPFSGKSIGPYNAASSVDAESKTRSYSNTAYYLPIATRPNLKVLLNATVQKIVIEGNTNNEPSATGVQFLYDGKTEVLHVKNEVILSAGVFNSPKILELSGIGNPEVLRAAGVDVKVANPCVGTNLQDHILTAISYETVDGVFTGDDLMRKNPEVLKWAMETYQQHKAGPFCSPGISSFGYLPTTDFSQDITARDSVLASIEKTEISHPLDFARLRFLETLLKNGDEGTGQYFIFCAQSASAGLDTTAEAGGNNGSNPQDGNFISLVAALSHPLSSGTVHITSSDAATPPTIDHQYLSNPIDHELQARHLRYLDTIAGTEPLASRLKKSGRRNHPAAFIGSDLEKAKEFVRIGSTTNWHSVGTCAMAPKDKGGVVDNQLRVYGVKGLRVVDASVFPLVPQSNTQSLVYAVAERVSDLIRGKL